MDGFSGHLALSFWREGQTEHGRLARSLFGIPAIDCAGGYLIQYYLTAAVYNNNMSSANWNK